MDGAILKRVIKENQDYDFSYEISLKEIINNSTDEALAGFGNKIEIGIESKETEVKNNEVSVQSQHKEK